MVEEPQGSQSLTLATQFRYNFTSAKVANIVSGFKPEACVDPPWGQRPHRAPRLADEADWKK